MCYSDPRTKFLPRVTAEGKWAFESYCDRGKFIVFEKTVSENDTEIRLKLDFPRNRSELFEPLSPFNGVFVYKSSEIEPEACYIGFDSFGNNCGELMCELPISERSAHIRHIETVAETNCQHTLLTSGKMEL